MPGWWTACGFKSHHSGMETGQALFHRLAQLYALNRTIVGWKRKGPSGRRRPRPPFKSHHSGMETMTKRHRRPDDCPLNRTIVGWKPRLGLGLRGALPALNRTIVGWKRARSWAWAPHLYPLNRTIVGWKHGIRYPGYNLEVAFKSHHSGMETRNQIPRLQPRSRL